MTISSLSAASQAPAVQNTPAPKAQTPAATAAQTKDTVHLSAAALAASSGDKDHDGDSH
jgi:hypothetical protein